MNDGSVLDQLNEVQSQYRRKDLRNQLEELGEELEQLLLDKALYEGLFDTTIEIDNNLKATIRETRSQLEDGDMDAVEQGIKSIQDEKEAFESTLKQEVADSLSTWRSNLDSMIRLNKAIEKMDADDLDELQTFLRPGNLSPDLEFAGDPSLEQKIERTHEYGANHRETFLEATTEIFEPYLNDDDIGDAVKTLLSGDEFFIEDLDPETFQQLKDSELSAYIELSFG